VALTTSTLILAVVLWNLLSNAAATQTPLAPLSSGSPTQSASLAVTNKAPCPTGGTAPERPNAARQETTLELDLSQGGKTHEVTLIVPAIELAFLSDGRITTANHLVLGDQVLISGNKVGLVRKAETAWYTPPPAPTRDANGNVLSRVIGTSKRLADQMLYLYTASDVIKTTPEHPFFVPDRGWVEAVHLQRGDRIQTQVGSFVTIERSELRNEQEMVYNLTVEGTNNFYVGKEQLLAHNCAYHLLNRTPAEIVGKTPFRSTNATISKSKVGRYLQDMQSGNFDWSKMIDPDTGAREFIEIGIAPSGQRYLLDGHHRYIAAKAADLDIPDIAIKYRNLTREPPQLFDWNNVPWEP
jgi:hypothetical protein